MFILADKKVLLKKMDTFFCLAKYDYDVLHIDYNLP